MMPLRKRYDYVFPLPADVQSAVDSERIKKELTEGLNLTGEEDLQATSDSIEILVEEEVTDRIRKQGNQIIKGGEKQAEQRVDQHDQIKDDAW